jgi:hypothetical protein
MRGHLRKRGEPGSWEYIVDVGLAAAQRCTACNKGLWIERRRETKAGFATRKECQASTYNSYVRHVEYHIVPHIGSVTLQKLTGSQVNALYAKLAQSGAKDGKKGLSPMTIHHVHACLHKACKDAVSWGPSLGIHQVPPTRRARRATARR